MGFISFLTAFSTVPWQKLFYVFMSKSGGDRWFWGTVKCKSRGLIHPYMVRTLHSLLLQTPLLLQEVPACNAGPLLQSHSNPQKVSSGKMLLFFLLFQNHIVTNPWETTVKDVKLPSALLCSQWFILKSFFSAQRETQSLKSKMLSSLLWLPLLLSLMLSSIIDVLNNFRTR